MMKQFLLSLAALVAAYGATAQTLFTYGTNTVSKNEFLKAYNKNKTPDAGSEQSLKEYLDLYIKFKLKVKEATALRIDTLPQIQYDVQNFKNQLEESYLNDEKTLNVLVDDAFKKSHKDIHVLHFYVPLNPKSTAAEITQAEKAINEAREELQKGETNYDEMVEESKQKGELLKGSDLGFITVFSLPYPMENQVYELKPGAVTKPYRNKSGLHIFKNMEERESAGKWKVAQILLAVPPDVSGTELKAIEKRADSIYSALKAGADFTAMVKAYSDDRMTYQTGGEMPEFGTGRFEPPFERAVFALKNDGDITKPIFTAFGFHIVKRLAQTPTPEEKTDEVIALIKQQVLADPRVEIAKANFTQDITAKTGFKRNPLVKDEELFRYADSIASTGVVKNFPLSKKIIFSFSKSNVKGSDWLNFVRDYKLNQDVYRGEDNKALLNKYISTVITEYYRKHLDEYNEDFKYQVKEFKEGNMLFEIMEQKIWSKASADSIGLKKYYAANKAKYVWDKSADAYLFNCNSLKTAEAAVAALRNGKDWEKITQESEGTIQADSGRYEIAQLQIPVGASLSEGTISEPLLNAGDNTAGFVKVLRIYPAGQQRSFEEAKGLVINDYQTYLEEQWVASLKKKYPVKVDEKIFKSLLK